MKKKMRWISIGLAAILVAVLTLTFMPVGVSVTGWGRLSLQSSVALAQTANISNVPSSRAFGVVETSSIHSTGLAYFVVTNNSGAPVNITILGTDMTGGITWTLSNTASPGSNIVGFKAGKPSSSLIIGFASDTSLPIIGFANDTSLHYVGVVGEGYTIIVKKDSPYNNLVAGMPDGATQKWGLRMYAPTEFSDSAEKTGTITLTATLS